MLPLRVVTQTASEATAIPKGWFRSFAIVSTSPPPTRGLRARRTRPVPVAVQYTPSANLDSGTWGRAELSLDFTTQPATIGLALNGASVLSRGSQLGLAPTDEVRVGVGVTYTDPSPAFEMGTDDVVVTLE